MNRFFIPSKFLVAATLATVAIGAATVAEAARPEINVTVDFQSGPGWVQPSRGYYAQPEPVYVQPWPVYAQPAPAYVQPWPVYAPPAPVYARPPVFVSPREVYEQPRFGRYDGRFEWERERAWRHAEWRRQEWRRHEWREEHRGRGHDRDDDDGRRGGHRD